MDPNTGNSASAAGPKKDKKSKKSIEDGDGKKKFVSIPQVELDIYDLAPNFTDSSVSSDATKQQTHPTCIYCNPMLCS